MDTIIDIEGLLSSIQNELDDFEEDLEMGASDRQFDLMSTDWALLLHTYILVILEKSYENLTATQLNIFIDLIKRTKKLKPEILAKNYRYPEEIDAFLDKLEKNK